MLPGSCAENNANYTQAYIYVGENCGEANAYWFSATPSFLPLSLNLFLSSPVLLLPFLLCLLLLQP
jgi:hypothetical protein